MRGDAENIWKLVGEQKAWVLISGYVPDSNMRNQVTYIQSYKPT